MPASLTPNWKTWVLIVLGLFVAWFAWDVRSVLNPLILGYLLAFVLHPMVLRLERRGWRRRRAVNFIFFASALGITLIGILVFMQGRSLAREFGAENGLGKRVVERVDQFLDEYHEQVSWIVSHLPAEKQRELAASGADPAHPQLTPDSRAELTRLVQEWATGWVTGDRGGKLADFTYVLMERVFGSVLAFGMLVLLLPIYTWFLLFELERIHRFVQRYLPKRERERLVEIGGQIGEVLASFFRGRLLVCLAKGIFLAAGLWLVGVDYALLLGLGTGFLSLIPFVGSLIGFVMCLAVALLEHSVVGSLVRAGSVFAAAELFENYVLLPKILGDSLGLHPIVVIFALMAGGASMGMFGLLIALPLTAALVILAREFLLPVLAELADRDPARRS